MSWTTIPLFAVYLVLCRAATEPEPGTYTTSVIEPEPASAQETTAITTSAEPAATSTLPDSTSASTQQDTTSTVPGSTSASTQQYTTSIAAGNTIQVVILDVQLLALNFADEEALVLALRHGIRNGAGVSMANVHVTVHNITVKISYSGLPALTGAFTENAFVQALAIAMNVSTQSLEVSFENAVSNVRRLELGTGFRRLQTSAAVAVTVANEANMDVVKKASQVITAANNAALLAEKIIDVIGIGVSPPVLQTPPYVVVAATSDILTASDAELKESDIKVQVESSVGGTVTVRSISEGTTTTMITTTKAAIQTTTARQSADTSSALPTSRMMAIWVAAFAIVLS